MDKGHNLPALNCVNNNYNGGSCTHQGFLDPVTSDGK